MVSRISFALTLGLGVILLAGCGQSSSEPKTQVSGEVTIAASEWKFEPASIRSQVGKPTKLTLRNDGKTDHNITIQGMMADGKEFVIQSKIGESTTMEFSPDKAGTYEIFCSLPGHKDAGMKGKVDVAAGG